jgi:predicted dehydrogenase
MSTNRRKFLRNLSGTAALLTAGSIKSLAYQQQQEERILAWEKSYSANDKIRLAVIGFGIQGHFDLSAALKVPGVELVGVCDLYTGRLDAAKEQYGNQIFTTKKYEEVLDRSDVDAVIIATADSWHSKITIDALNNGKAVYCEKPMVHHIDQGWGVINAQQKTGKVLQVGSQGIAGLMYAKAKELYEAGEIGSINSVEAVNNRQSAIGAWEYTIPLDANEHTVDWQRYQAIVKNKVAFEDKRFFWWRNYRDYGTGVAGDLFVHLLTGLHFVTGSKGPATIFSLGDISYWNDGRDVPDVMTSVLHYPKATEHPAFQTTLRINFASGDGDNGYVKITGTDGVMIIGDKLTVKRKKMPKAAGIGGYDSLFTYTKDMQTKLLEDYKTKHGPDDQKSQTLPDITYVEPNGFDDHVQHFTNFFESVRNGKAVVENAVFGFRAAAPCLACNASHFDNKIIHWDAQNMKLV